jgi:hypothetical protein
MSLRNSLSVVLAFASLALLAACGSGNAHITPPPSGAFSDGNLTGTYVFSASGTTVTGAFFAATGTIQANGSGAITGGVLDLNDAGQGVFLDTINAGTYNVSADGRGTATLSTSNGDFGLAFVLTSGSHGLVTRFDNGGSGSGSLDLQGTVSQSQIAGSYAMNLSGVGNSLGNPMATVAGFTLDSAGAFTSGEQDLNDFGSALTQLPLDGNVTVGTSDLPGTASLITSTTLGTLSFDVFPIDATHLKFIETDTIAILAGDAFTQTTFPSGTTVFNLAGLDFTQIQPVPFVAGGFMNGDGNGNILSTSTEDLNDGGTLGTGIVFSGLYPALDLNGRTELSLVGFDNANLAGTTAFAAYPSTGGLQLLESDNNGITGGFALSQSDTTLAEGQGYGLNLTASNGGSFEEDDIAEFTNSSGAFAGVIDFNDQGTLSAQNSFSATYTADASNTGRATVAASAFNLLSYVVSGSNVLFIETDSNQVGLGSFQLQSTPTAGAAANHLASLRVAAHPHPALKRKHAASNSRVR